jgi:hypothetical protein
LHATGTAIVRQSKHGDLAAAWVARPRDAPALTDEQLAFLAASCTMQTRRRLIQIGLQLLLVGILIYFGWSNWSYLKVRWRAWTDN